MLGSAECLLWLASVISIPGLSNIIKYSRKQKGSFTYSAKMLSGQLQSFSPNHSSEKMPIIATDGKVKLYLSSSLLQFRTEEQLILRTTILTYLTCTSAGSISEQLYHVVNVNRFWSTLYSHKLCSVLVSPDSLTWTKPWKNILLLY